MKITIVIPNFNGIKFMGPCLESLRNQDYKDFSIIMVDNGSADGSLELVREKYPEVSILALGENTGFSKAVNEGIKASESPYVLLLNNDTEVKPGFLKYLLEAMEAGPGSEKIFSVGARMLVMAQPEKIDNAGDYYCALGWAYARGQGEAAWKFEKPARVFSACAGAALYRRAIFDKIGLFDEGHFAYLEDVDIGYRARIYGYRNLYEPRAQVLHAGSGSSGSRHNLFKVRLASANSVYLIGKNMPLLQWIWNLPFLLLGYSLKWLFFFRKGMGTEYAKGCLKGLKRCFGAEGRKKKIKFQWRNLGNYIMIQLELWINVVRFFIKS